MSLEGSLTSRYAQLRSPNSGIGEPCVLRLHGAPQLGFDICRPGCKPQCMRTLGTYLGSRMLQLFFVRFFVLALKGRPGDSCLWQFARAMRIIILHSSLRQRHDDETIVFRSYLSPCSTIAWLQASWFHVSRLMCLVSVCMMGKACICALTGILPMIIVSDISLAYLGDESN